MSPDLSSFAARLRQCFAPDAPCDFAALALELFALQFRHNTPYRKLCEARGAVPGRVSCWTEIPAVPTAAFKEFDLTCLPPAERTFLFHSSGTTGQQPSRHFHNAESLAVYEASALSWFNRNPCAEGTLLVLTPPAPAVPRSSLVHMFDAIRRDRRLPESVFFGRTAPEGSWELDFTRVLHELQRASSGGGPVALFGTAFSFVHLLDHLADANRRFELPEGSSALETGGYKGRSRSLPKADLHALITARLGIPAGRIQCEYGMSELSSQAYASVEAGARSIHPTLFFPPWARPVVVSPEIGREVGDGETGLLRVFDLANVGSVLAVQTEDLAVRRARGFELIGRAAMSEPRGCSLMAS